MTAVQWSHVALVELTCWAREGCGVHFAIPQKLWDTAGQHGHSFYCPKGHLLCRGDSDVQKLKKELEEKERQLTAARAREQMARNNEKSARHGAAIAKGKLRAQLERIKNGVCPCCNRSFQNVRRHMASKHPDALERLKAHESEGGSK